MKQFRILHTNDIHSYFETYPKLATFLEKQQDTIPTRLMDIGDNMDRFHPITEATSGKINTLMLNKLGYDYVTFGNNEGITLDYNALSELYDSATFQVLAANLYEKDKKRPDWLSPYVIENINGMNIGFIGVTVYYKLFYDLLGWYIIDPFEAMESCLQNIKDKTDAIIVLSHLGISDDEQLASRFPEIDVILGGHTHHVLPEGKMIGNTLLCGAGKHGAYIGEVNIAIEGNQIHKSCLLHSLNDVDSNKELEQEINDAYNLAKKSLSEPIVHISYPLISRWFEQSPLASTLAEALKEWCRADIGMVNNGVILNNLEAGVISAEQIHRICPHPINPCKVELKGEELREIILEANKEEHEQIRVKGLGFRGEVMGKMSFSNLEIIYGQNKDGVKIIKEILVANVPLKLAETYSVGTIDMFTFGKWFPTIKRAKKQFYMPELLRDVLTWKLKKLTKEMCK
ncbi:MULTISPECIES: bifunctional metallophosphatase/5'-nucleotidase [Bacillus]|uniref:bifunctional metallophosphatase/5'-nucleotidase n=1 Tax=Bacillus TaxID=1386 RepID=UPI000BB759A8|nr:MULTISPECIES: bifunctional UDP-sugar hydrolase/5'-nucleotidase [Bacillus]